MEELSYRLELDDCIRWIDHNKFKRVVIELKQEDMMHAATISDYLTNGLKKKNISDPEIYVTRSNTCSVDLVVTQHISDVDAIIHLGQVCLTKIPVKNLDHEPVIMFGFGRMKDEDLINRVYTIINEKILSFKDMNCDVIIFYDTCLIDLAISIEQNLINTGLNKLCEVATLNKMSIKWHTTACHSKLFKCKEDGDMQSQSPFDQFCTKKSLQDYNHAIYIGNRLSMSSILNFKGSLYRINLPSTTPVIEEVQTTKLLYKRVALVDQIKDQEELRIGVILTNPLPDVPKIMERLHLYAKQRNHTLYFITMIQTIDECKIGNFDLCDAFVIINSCACSTILESLCFNRPIISELEFKLACGYEVEYGNVLWPGTSIHLTEDDLINRRKVSDVSLALIHTRNELLERCSQARANKWSGLDYSKASGKDDHDESLTVHEGLHGFASAYVSEPSIQEEEK